MDIIIIASFLIITLLVGIFSGKGIKDVKDYSIANQSYTTIPILLTFLATMIGGDDTTGDLAEFYQAGIIYALPYLGFIISILIMARYIAPKFDYRFRGMISVSDVMEYFYGDKIARVTGVIATLATLGYAAAQNIALGHLISEVTNLSYKWSVIIAGGIVIFYTAFGGIRSVVVTDIIQFSILIVMVPIICNVALTHVGGLAALINTTPETHASIFNREDLYEYIALFFIWLIPVNCFFPAMIQRFLMAQNTKQISQISYIYAAVLFALLLIMICLSLSAVILFPDINAKQIIPHVINTLLPTGIKGLAISGMIAVIMSTIDSNLNTSGIIFTHNVFRLKQISELKQMQFNTMLFGIFALCVALQDYGIINLIVFVQVALAIGVGIPLSAGLFKFKVHKNDFWSCLCCANIAMVLAILWQKEINYISSFMILFFGFVSFFTSYLIRRRKYIKFSIKYNVIAKYLKFIQKGEIKKVLGFNKLIAFSNRSVNNYGANYLMFGVFSCINYIVPYFMWPHEIKSYYPLLLSLRIFAGLLCIGLLLKEYWNAKFNKYFSLYWFFTLLYTLVLMPTVMFLLNSEIFEWLMNIALGIFILALLVDWVVFLFIQVIGILIGYSICLYLLGSINIHQTSRNIYLGIYLLIFSILIGLTFSRRRDFSIKEKFNIIKAYGGLMAHELKEPLAQLSIATGTVRKILNRSIVERSKGKCLVAYKEKDYDILIKKAKEYQWHITDGNNMIDNLLMSIDQNIFSSKKGVYNLQEIVEEVIKNIPIKKKS